MNTNKAAPNTEPTWPEIEAAYKRGVAHGYDLGLKDGRLTPQQLAQKFLRMKTWIPKRHTDKTTKKANQ